MLINRWVRRMASAGSTLALLLALAPCSFGQVTLGQPSCAQPGCGPAQSCEPSCNMWNCPPAYVHCQEGPPRICIQCGCPKPVCCPSDAPNWGYFQTCWRPYPWGPNLAHCFGAPPAPQIMPPPPSAMPMPQNTFAPMPPVHSVPLPPGSDLPGSLTNARPSAVPPSILRPGT